MVDRAKKSYRFTVLTGTPNAEQKKAIEAGTKLGRGCKFRCLLSDEPIPEKHIKQAGIRGELSATLMAVVAEGTDGRVYLPPYATPPLQIERPKDLKGIDAPLANDPRNLWCLGYGLDTFDKIFTARQLLALTTFSDMVQEARSRVLADAKQAALPSDDLSLAEGGVGPLAYADAIATYLGLGVAKATDRNSSLCSWEPGMDRMRSTFGRQALPMVWDFTETAPFADAAGDIFSAMHTIAKVLEKIPDSTVGVSTQLDAMSAMIDVRSPLISTDPPYYDNIGYADLSDYFYIWLRRSIGRVYPMLFATLLTPKKQELIASPYRHEGKKDAAQVFFEDGLSGAFCRMREAQALEFPLTVYYAFKQAESDDGNNEDIIGSSNGAWHRQAGRLCWPDWCDPVSPFMELGRCEPNLLCEWLASAPTRLPPPSFSSADRGLQTLH